MIVFIGREVCCWKYVGGKLLLRLLFVGRWFGDVFWRVFWGVVESGWDWCWELRIGDEECMSVW